MDIENFTHLSKKRMSHEKTSNYSFIVSASLLIIFMISNRTAANTSHRYENDNLDSMLAYEDAYATVLLDPDFYEPVFMMTDEGIIQFCNDSINEAYIILNLLERKNDKYRAIAWKHMETPRKHMETPCKQWDT